MEILEEEVSHLACSVPFMPSHTGSYPNANGKEHSGIMFLGTALSMEAFANYSGTVYSSDFATGEGRDDNGCGR